MASNECNKCNKFFNSTAIQRHRRRPHFLCSQCNRYFLEKEWRNHEKICGIPRLEKSCACGVKLTPKALVKHAARPHGTQRCGCFILLSDSPSHLANCEQYKEFQRVSTAYIAKAKEGLHLARTEFRVITSKGAHTSRGRQQGPVFLDILDGAILGTPITAAEYLAASEYQRNTFVLCSTDEARRILEAGSPRIPILIPAEWNQDRNSLSMVQFWEYLGSFPTVDVHDFDQALPNGLITPRSMDPLSAFALFRDPAHGPINMLNLGAYKENPIPSCMVGLPAYGIMTQVKEQSGKLEQPVVLDLSDSARFQLCGKRGGLLVAPHRPARGDHDGLQR